MRMKIQVWIWQKWRGWTADCAQLLSFRSFPRCATQVGEAEFSAGRRSTTKLQPESAVHPGKSTNMGTWNHAGCARLRDGTWGNTKPTSEGQKSAFLNWILRSVAAAFPAVRSAETELPARVAGVDPGLLRCVPAAPRSSVREVNLSPDDGRGLPQLQLCGRAGPTSTARSFLGLWPRRRGCQAEVGEEAAGSFRERGSLTEPLYSFSEGVGARRIWAGIEFPPNSSSCRGVKLGGVFGASVCSFWLMFVSTRCLQKPGQT